MPGMLFVIFLSAFLLTFFTVSQRRFPRFPLLLFCLLVFPPFPRHLLLFPEVTHAESALRAL